MDWSQFITDFPEFKQFERVKKSVFSSGQSRLIEIYLVLKSPSEIILLDEPFSSLSPIYSEKIKTILEKEKINKIIILTDHRYREVLSVAEVFYLADQRHIFPLKDKNGLVDYGYVPM